jgi:hypothetical protein
MKAKCHNCKMWEEREARYIYHMAAMTNWIPELGYDSNLREFRCSNCGDTFYKLLTPEELERARREVA